MDPTNDLNYYIDFTKSSLAPQENQGCPQAVSNKRNRNIYKHKLQKQKKTKKLELKKIEEIAEAERNRENNECKLMANEDNSRLWDVHTALSSNEGGDYSKWMNRVLDDIESSHVTHQNMAMNWLIWLTVIKIKFIID